MQQDTKVLWLKKKIGAAVDRFADGDASRSVSILCEEPISYSFSRNEDAPRPAASVMKLPLAMSVYRKAQRGELNLGETVLVSSLQKTRYVSIVAGFDAQRALSLREVCRLMLITSDNPLAVALQRFTSFEDVNDLIHSLGCGGECIMHAGFTEAELGPPNRANQLTASACIELLREVRSNHSYRDLFLALQNNLRNNRIPARLPETAIVAHKTGSLDRVANDVGFVHDGNVSFAIACLTDQQTDTERTGVDISACAAEIFASLQAFKSN